MIVTPSTNATTPCQPRFSGPILRVLLAAFLFFGLAAPFASANCLSKGLTQPQFSSLAQSGPALLERAQPLTLDTKASVSIVGLWNLSFVSGGEVVDVAFDAWHSDGTEILNDYTDPIEGNVCLGVWEQTGPRTYKLKHPSWYFDNNGTLLGTVVIHETVNLSADGNSFTGSYTDDVYDVSGNLLEAYSGKLKATRIKPD
jgi:hypothetical protein